MTVKERITALRERMKEKKIDAYLVPTDDFHASEYVGEYFKCRKYITGFTGSAGTAVIMQDMAGLWTDGRYFIQAAAQLEGTGVDLFKMGEPGVPTIHQFLEEKLGEGMCLGFDGRTISAKEAAELSESLGKKGASLSVDYDLVGEVWEDRPALSCEPVMELDVKWAGESRADKCAKIRKAMEEKGADAFVLTSLDDIAWLLNIRGGDVHCCPVVLSYLVMTQKEIKLFANEKAFPAEVLDALAKDGVTLLPYDSIYEYVKTFAKDMKVLLCKQKANSRLVSNIPAEVEILDEENLTLLPKAIKNPVEVENERIAHIRDGVALTKFIYWLKKNVGKIPMTELSAEEKLYSFRAQQENFIDNSFDPIISYGVHAAINHYSSTPETDIPIEPRSFLLADTGGNYYEGTTDTTRTIVMGPVTDEQKKFFTAVLRGMLNLGNAKFRYGCTGVNLDYLARGPLWELGQDFNHGTGHGVGYLLNVHEGPNSFRWKVVPGNNAVLEEGMITSDEPGYYVEDGYGIRHENMIVCKKAEKTQFGQFMCFEFLTMVPFDLDAVVPEQMTAHERELLNNYHAQVYEKISPYLDEDEKAWLKEATRAI
ncbi:aminopeptidase P family protein [Blautia sp. MSJ-9]|uniref:aminopeptidase P family protein n=1 Tax=Blautia sp. MSJ-9 TaxID=2841511 RepID=UPI001C0F4CA5|nr:aminopeptidase P family protein [Blautia sp. MSJ-9]MBU5679818.1 aminopeptidase P family protein [Blautia sp. MSJ-9]